MLLLGLSILKEKNGARKGRVGDFVEWGSAGASHTTGSNSNTGQGQPEWEQDGGHQR